MVYSTKQGGNQKNAGTSVMDGAIMETTAISITRRRENAGTSIKGTVGMDHFAGMSTQPNTGMSQILVQEKIQPRPRKHHKR